MSFCYSAHSQKGAELAIDVMAGVKDAVRDLEAIVFGATPPEHVLPDWVTYVERPSARHLVEGIYNTSRVFLCTSYVEGFGLPSVEAMACGAALVTTDNGGSRDYAFHEQTALVGRYGDVDALSEHVIALLDDDERRLVLATAGRRYVQRFDWERTGELLEAFLERYVADPATHGYAVQRG